MKITWPLFSGHGVYYIATFGKEEIALYYSSSGMWVPRYRVAYFDLPESSNKRAYELITLMQWVQVCASISDRTWEKVHGKHLSPGCISSGEGIKVEKFNPCTSGIQKVLPGVDYNHRCWHEREDPVHGPNFGSHVKISQAHAIGKLHLSWCGTQRWVNRVQHIQRKSDCRMSVKEN